MKRICCLLTLCLLAGVSLLFAADFWEKKDFATWSEEETTKMLEDSPWAKKTRVKYDAENPRSNTGGGGFGGGGGGGFGGGGFGGGGGMRGGGMMGGGMMGGGGGGGMGGPPFVTLRWASATPVKQAIARHNYKDQVSTSKEAAEMLQRKESAHILAVIGLPGQQASYSEDLIKTYSYLKTGDRPLIRPSQVVFPQSQDIPGKVNVYVIFPKFKDDGSPMFTLEDKKIELLITAGMYDISKKFDLGDMVYKGALNF